jgi:hypothetical protein
MKQRAAHMLVAKMARDMACEIYEDCARDNVFRKLNPNMEDFVERTYGSLLDQARQVLAAMLQRDDIGDLLKNQIYEALCLDEMFQRPANVVVPQSGREAREMLTKH